MKVTVCQLRNVPAGLDQDWLALIDHVTSEKSDLGVTSPGRPFLTVEIDLEVAQNAKHTYPRYVKE